MAEKSRMTREWIARVWADNPCRMLDNGNMITGPVRLAFANILERGKPQPPKTEGSFGAVLLFPEGVDLSVPKAQVLDLIRENAPAALANQALADRLNKPLKKQDTFVDKEGRLYDGFAEGRVCISANSGSQPPCVDMGLAPIVDKKHVYSGCWAIVTLAPKWFDVGTNKGPTFYLQSVMVVADDENIGGTGSANPNSDFAGVKIDATVNPSAAFENMKPADGGAAAAAGGVDLFG